MTSLAGTSDVRAFFNALLIPMTVGVALALSAVTLDVRGPVVALVLNAFLVSEVAGFSDALPLPMPAWYLRSRRFEQPWLYEWLGIRAFKKLMRSRLYRRVNPDFQLIGGRSGLPALREKMHASEIAHGLAFLAAAAFAAGALSFRWLDAAAWITLFNVLFNGYPVMLQRYNRIRLQRLTSVVRV
jgi:hypothetical protein